MSKSNVVPFTGVTSHDINPDVVLDAAKGELKKVVLMGFDKDGYLYTASSVSDGGDVLWLMELTKMRLMNMDDE